MKLRIFVAAIAVPLVLAAATATASVNRVAKAQANTLTVWLQVDAQSGWPDLVAAANQQFQAASPRLDRERPVPELERPSAEVRRDARGRHHARRDRDGQHRDGQVHGGRCVRRHLVVQDDLRQLGELAQGPRQVGSVRRQDATACRITPARASSRTAPTSTRRPGSRRRRPASRHSPADAAKLAAKNSGVKGFSPVYTAGTDWYFAMSFVYDFGGQIASTYKGKWVGDLDYEEVDRRTDGVQELLQGGLEGEPDLERERPGSVHRVLAGPGRLDRRTGLVQLLRRQDVHERHQAVRDAEPHARPRDAGLPRRLRPRSPGTERQQGARGRLDQGLHEHEQREGPAGEGQHPERDQPARAPASTSGQPPAAGSSRRRSTGSTSRTGISCATCWPQILSGKLSVQQAAQSASANIQSVLNQP